MRYLISYNKLFEGYPPHKFEIDSEREFKELYPDVKDIFLELIDSGVVVDIDKYIDDIIFEFHIEIGTSLFGGVSKMLKTGDQKQLCEDCLLRLESFLSDSGIHLAKIEMVQYESGWRHDFEMYDMDELSNLKDTAGEINILIYFSKHND